jgi:uncharacterized membrane protein YdbT with pleckstrin-like domain
MDNFIVKKINPRAGEEVVAVVRHYGLTFWPKILAVILLLGLTFFFLFPLFSLGYWGEIIFFFLIFLAALYASYIFVIWYYNAFVVTNIRVVDIDQRGFFERIISETTLDKIQDVSYRHKGIFQTIFRYGDLRIEIAGTDAGLEIKNVCHPGRAQQVISDVVHLNERRPDKIIVTPEISAIKKSIDNLNENDLAELDNLIRNKLREIKI